MTSAEQKDVQMQPAAAAPVELWDNVREVMKWCQDLLQFNESKIEAKFMDLLKTYPKCFTLQMANQIWSWLYKLPRNSLGVLTMLEAVTGMMTRLTRSSADALASDWDINVMSLRRVVLYAMHWPALPDDQKPALRSLFQQIEVFLGTMRRLKEMVGISVVCDCAKAPKDFESWDFANAKDEKGTGMVTVALKTPCEMIVHVTGGFMGHSWNLPTFDIFKTHSVKHYIFVSAIECKDNDNQLQHLSFNWFCTPCTPLCHHVFELKQ